VLSVVGFIGSTLSSNTNCLGSGRPEINFLLGGVVCSIPECIASGDTSAPQESQQLLVVLRDNQRKAIKGVIALFPILGP